MLILGLGTNLGDGLNNLRSALQLLQKSSTIAPLQISPVYTSSALLPAYAPAAWNRPYLNVALACETSLSPFETLRQIKQIEKQLGREESQRWAPRVIDIDILAWDDLVMDEADLKIPHAELLARPFALWPLLDLWPNWKHPSVEFYSKPSGLWNPANSTTFSGQCFSRYIKYNRRFFFRWRSIC